MCNQTFHMDLVKLSSQYIDNSFIMEQISCITMYFATMRTWITFPEVLTLVKNLMSYTYAICDDRSPAHCGQRATPSHLPDLLHLPEHGPVP